MFYKSEKFGGICLLISQFFERITFYSILANLVYTLNSSPLSWTITNSMNAAFTLTGCCFIATMIGGILSDTVFKKTTVVIIGYVFYMAFSGFIFIFINSKDLKNMTIISACHNNSSKNRSFFRETCWNLLLTSLVLCAIGSGMIKSVVASIGADMAHQKWSNPSVFFSIYYWSLNCGSLIAYLGIAFMQQNVSRFYGFVIPGVILILSFIFFLLGIPYYVKVPKPARSTIVLVCSVYYEAISRLLSSKQKERSINAPTSSFYVSHKDSNENFERKVSFHNIKSDLPSLTLSYKRDSDSTDDDVSTIAESSTSTVMAQLGMLDRCKIRFGGRFSEDDVEDVRKFNKFVGVLFCLISYFTLYFQIDTTYFFQALHMRVPFFNDNNNKIFIPPCYLSTTDILIVMIVLPILVNFVYPCLKRHKFYPNNFYQILFGMILAMVSLVLAGVVDIFVIKNYSNSVVQTIGGSNYSYADFSVFFQLPQMAFMGLSETQAVVAGIEMACTEVPKSMQGMTNGMFWFVSGIGSFIGIGLVSAFQMDDAYDKPNPATKHYFFWITILQTPFILIIVLYIWKSKKNKDRSSTLVTSVTISS